MLDRNTIFAACFERLKSEVAVNFATDSHITVNDLASSGKQPAMEFNRTGWRDLNEPGRGPTSTLTATVYLFARQGSRNDAGTDLAALAQEIESALRSQPGEVGSGCQTTLGGLVEWAWVTAVAIDHGDLSGQGVAEVTIEMLAVE